VYKIPVNFKEIKVCDYSFTFKSKEIFAVENLKLGFLPRRKK